MIAFALRYWKLIAVAVALALTFGAGWRLASSSYRAEIAELRQEYAEAAAKAQAQYRQKETESQARVDQAEANHVVQLSVIETKLRVADVVGSRLRDELSAAKRRTAADPAPVRAIDDPALIGELLANFDEAAGVCAKENDEARAQVRGLQNYIDAIR